MRGRESSEDVEVKAGRGVKRADSAGGGERRGLLALQGTVGNAAVVQLLRRAGHLGAEEEGRAVVQRSTVHEVLRAGGRPLDGPTRTDMEARLGADFSDVRVHDNAAARASAAEVGARAYTSGSHVVIGAGGADRHTLAHELTHVIQQRRGPVSGNDNGDGLRLSDPSDRFEREAEATATRVMSGPAPLQDADHDLGAPGAPLPDRVAAAGAVQRAVVVGGSPVSDPAVLLREKDLEYLVTTTGERVLRYLKSPGADAVLEAADADGLVLEIGRIGAMIDLVQGINRSGILGRASLVEQGIAHTGSNDTGNSTALAVNVLDARGIQDPDRIRAIVAQSLTDPNNGSFSVAMERPEDEDFVLDQLSWAKGGELSEQQLADVRQSAQGDEGTARALISFMKGEKLSEAQGEMLAGYVSMLQERTQNTAMAIVNRPGADVTTLSAGAGAYESDVPSDKIPPGARGFTSLVLPAWFEPYGPLLMNQDWPQGVALRFAGNKQVTAHFRAKGTDWPVTVEAPDYGTEIERQLQQFKVIATHILKVAGT
ncbi:DUF4157 domain-containing protein [Streptomyces sp. NPDC059564]|uniref:eCIS core domain-containing protein n=1 Tax=Streptomyces sp. NPDC059564 TaxID=3346865 RepID=UPI0036B9FAFE